MTATTIGMSRSLVEVLAGCPSPDGDGAAEAAAGGDGVASADAAGVALAATAAVALGDGAGAYVNPVVPRSRSPSTADADVHRTSYVPTSSWASASVIFLASAASTWPPDAIWAPAAFRTTIELLEGSRASVKVATISAGALVTVEPFAGVIVSSSAWPRTAAGAARATMTAAAASRLTDRPRPGRGARVMAASVRATPPSRWGPNGPKTGIDRDRVGGDGPGRFTPTGVGLRRSLDQAAWCVAPPCWPLSRLVPATA